MQVSDEKEKIEAEKESAYGEVVDIDVYIEILPKSSLKTTTSSMNLNAQNLSLRGHLDDDV
ncbi:hypothetical protein ACLOJK_039152 [Asimina triloba]